MSLIINVLCKKMMHATYLTKITRKHCTFFVIRFELKHINKGYIHETLSRYQCKFNGDCLK